LSNRKSEGAGPSGPAMGTWTNFSSTL
jgi:hypothetical protein